jgi:hypothetical protein
MKTYKVEDIICMFGIFLDEEVEANNMSEAKEIVYNEIMDNLGNYIDIEMEEVTEDESDD